MGTSGSGTSLATTALLERLAEAQYQFCLIDPEGDYEELEKAVPVGDPKHTPPVDEVIRLLEDPTQNAVVYLLAIPLDDRPSFFALLWGRLEELRTRTGRPHWIAMDEAHHLLPSSRDPSADTIPDKLVNMLCVTVHPEHVAPFVLKEIGTVVALGQEPQKTLAALAKAAEIDEPGSAADFAGTGSMETRAGGGRLDVLLWKPPTPQPSWIRVTPPKQHLKRHQRKYATGELAPEKSFYFRGSEGKLNIRAQNLKMFLELGEGVDEDTWLFHLKNGDYSKWFRAMIGDEDLAEQVEKIERANVTADQSRQAIHQAIEKRYTAPE